VSEDEKVRFVSDAWLTAAQAIIDDDLATTRADMGGLSVRCSEVFTNAPADLPGRRDDGARAWHWELVGGQAIVGDGERDDVDLKVFADYDAILPFARATSEEAASDPELEMHRAALMWSGQLVVIGDRSALPAAINQLFSEIHDRLARITA
jgi:hypothetical protein